MAGGESDVPPFSLTPFSTQPLQNPAHALFAPLPVAVRPHYDQKTYWGRFMNFVEITSPLNLLMTKSELHASQALLERFKEMNPGADRRDARGKEDSGESVYKLPEGVDDAQLWRARRVVESMLHPDTKEIIPFPVRLSFFVPANIPIAAGMSLYAKSTASQLGWQVVNQGYNAAVNFANRNATVEVDMKELLQSAGLATSVACATAFAFGRLSARVEANQAISAAVRKFASRSVPYVAVATAGVFNVAAMRAKEMTSGVEVFDPETGVGYGKSQVAGKMAIFQSSLTRIVLPIPIIFLPPYLVEWAAKIPVVAAAAASSSAVSTALELGIVTVCLLVALPAAIALFPQEATVDTEKLEPAFRALKQQHTGKPITTLAFNKGL